MTKKSYFSQHELLSLEFLKVLEHQKRERRCKVIGWIQKKVKGYVIRWSKKKQPSNITYSDDKAMRELLDNQGIIIGPADKESGIVMVDTNKYIDQLESEIISNASYDEVKEDRIKQIPNKTKKLVKRTH